MVSGGETSGYGLLTVEENLWMFARFYGLDGKMAPLGHRSVIQRTRKTNMVESVLGVRQTTVTE